MHLLANTPFFSDLLAYTLLLFSKITLENTAYSRLLYILFTSFYKILHIRMLL